MDVSTKTRSELEEAARNKALAENPLILTTVGWPGPRVEGGVWRHYKGKLYRVVCRGLHESTQLPMVAYQDVEFGWVFFRSEHEFHDLVTDPNTLATVTRFKQVSRDPPPVTVRWETPPA